MQKPPPPLQDSKSVVNHMSRMHPMLIPPTSMKFPEAARLEINHTEGPTTIALGVLAVGIPRQAVDDIGHSGVRIMAQAWQQRPHYKSRAVRELWAVRIIIQICDNDGTWWGRSRLNLPPLRGHRRRRLADVFSGSRRPWVRETGRTYHSGGSATFSFLLQ